METIGTFKRGTKGARLPPALLNQPWPGLRVAEHGQEVRESFPSGFEHTKPPWTLRFPAREQLLMPRTNIGGPLKEREKINGTHPHPVHEPFARRDATGQDFACVIAGGAKPR